MSCVFPPVSLPGERQEGNHPDDVHHDVHPKLLHQLLSPQDMIVELPNVESPLVSSDWQDQRLSTALYKIEATTSAGEACVSGKASLVHRLLDLARDADSTKAIFGEQVGLQSPALWLFGVFAIKWIASKIAIEYTTDSIVNIEKSIRNDAEEQEIRQLLSEHLVIRQLRSSEPVDVTKHLRLAYSKLSLALFPGLHLEGGVPAGVIAMCMFKIQPKHFYTVAKRMRNGEMSEEYSLKHRILDAPSIVSKIAAVINFHRSKYKSDRLSLSIDDTKEALKEQKRLTLPNHDIQAVRS